MATFIPDENLARASAAGSGSASVPPLLRLLQLSSSLLPIGAFAYSHGLENAIEHGWVSDERSLEQWLVGVGEQSLAALDLPLLLRARQAWSTGDEGAALSTSRLLLSFRESRELSEQERHLGAAFARVLETLGVPGASALVRDDDVSYVACYALGSVHFELDDETAASGYAFAWLEQLSSAAARLVPLGHLAAQRALSRALSRAPGWVTASRDRDDDDVGQLTPGLAMASAWHESQYTRLFRS